VGNDENGNPKKQWPIYVFIKLHTKFAVEYIIGLITGQLNARDIMVKPKKNPFLDTKTKWVFVGTHNGFCPEALG